MSTSTPALDKLTALEQSAIAGEAVTAKQLSDARAIATAEADLAALVATGEQNRAAEATAATEADRRATAKAEAAEIVAAAGLDMLAEKLKAAGDAADEYVLAAIAHNAAAIAASEHMRSAGVPTRSRRSEPAAEHFDPDNYPSRGCAVVGGHRYGGASAGEWAALSPAHNQRIRDAKAAKLAEYVAEQQQIKEMYIARHGVAPA